MKKEKFQKGFSLIELVIYIAIFAVVAGAGIGILIIVLRIQSRETSSSEVAQQANFVMQTIQRLTRESSLIEMTAGNSETVLKLRMKDANVDPILISSDAAAVYLKQGTAATTTLTGSQVKVDGLFFRKYQNPGAHDSVTVDLSLSYNTENPQRMASRTLRSAIARASAAVFDSDLLPGSDNQYNIGASSPRWRNLRLSELLYLGAGSSDPAGSPGAIYYNTASSTFRGFRDTSWASLGGNWALSGNNIYNENSGNVGIGTTTPGVKLYVAGGEPVAYFTNSGDGTGSIRVFPGGTGSTGSIEAFGTSNLTNFNRIRMTSQGGGPHTIISDAGGTGTKQDINIYSDSSGQLYLKTNGNVGIGTTSPAALLSVAGQIYSSSGFRFPDGTVQTTAAISTVPSFSVYKNANQSVANQIDTLITWDAEEFDTNNNFVSNRFTPTVPGKYLLTAELELLITGGNQAFLKFYKNGSEYKIITADINSSAGRGGIHGAVIVDDNGSSDYFEVYLHQNTGNAMTVEGTAVKAWFAGARISN